MIEYYTFIGMLVVGIVLLAISAILYVKWDIAKARDELSGKQQQRRIEKLQKASMAIGVVDSTSSTTELLKDSEEEETISTLIQSAHGSLIKENESTSEKTGYIAEEDEETQVSSDQVQATIAPKSAILVPKGTRVTILNQVGNLD